ncbi:terminase large subunit domain protein, partial [Escherichia coli EC1856]
LCMNARKSMGCSG